MKYWTESLNRTSKLDVYCSRIKIPTTRKFKGILQFKSLHNISSNIPTWTAALIKTETAKTLLRIATTAYATKSESEGEVEYG